jgi:hypothetical protein
MTNTLPFMPVQTDQQCLAGIVSMVTDRVQAGFTPFLVTFMFSQIPGPDHVVDSIMNAEIERWYYLMVDRLITRKRTSPAHGWKLPFFFVVDDWPVPKRDRTDIQWLRPNDGRHKNGIMSMAPVSAQRVQRKLDDYIDDEQPRFVRPPLFRIHAVEIEVTPEKATRYALKFLERGRVTADDLLILPREAKAPYARRTGNSSIFSPEMTDQQNYPQQPT